MTATANSSNNVYSHCAVAALGAFFTSEAAKHQSIPRLMIAHKLVNYTITRLAEQAFPTFFNDRNSLSAFSLQQSISTLSLKATCAIATSFGLLESVASKVMQMHLFMVSCSIVEKALEPLVNKVAREIFNKYSIDEVYKDSATVVLKRFVSLGVVVILASSLGVVAAPQLLLLSKIHTLGTPILASIKLLVDITKAASIKLQQEEENSEANIQLRQEEEEEKKNPIDLQAMYERGKREAQERIQAIKIRALFDELPHFVSA